MRLARIIEVSYLVHNLRPCTTCACEWNNDCCIPCMCFHVITVTSDRPWTQNPGPRGHTPCILVGITRASQECGQIWEKPRYTVNGVPLTKNSLQAPLVALNYSVEYFHGKYTGLFQAFRWAEKGASGEQTENNKRAGIEIKKSNMSITQWRPYFHC